MAFFNDFMEESVIDMGGGLNDADSIKEAEYLESLEASDHGNVDFDELCLSVAVENEQNFNMIMNVTAVEELKYALEYGEVMPVTEGAVGDFFNKIKGWIDKAWTKVKEIFNKAISWIEGHIRNDKSIISKYGDDIKKFKGELDFKGYNFKAEELRAPVYAYIQSGTAYLLRNVTSLTSGYVASGGYGGGELGTNVTKDIASSGKNGFKETEFKDFSGKLRKAAVNGGEVKGTLGEEEFKTELKKKFGFNEKETVKYDGNAIFTELATGKTTRDCIKFGYSKAKNAFTMMKKEIKVVEKAIQTNLKNNGKEKGSNLTKYANAAGKCCSSAISILNTAQRIHIKALNTYHQQCRAMAVKAVNKKNSDSDKKKKKTNEAAFENGDFASFLV